MANCKVHPGTKSVGKINGVECCEKCKKDIADAVRQVDKHVEPKACFLWYEGGKTGWQPIPGTGCAHWVAHERSIKRGSASEQCMLGHPFRVKTLIDPESAMAVDGSAAATLPADALREQREQLRNSLRRGRAIDWDLVDRKRVV